MMCLELNRCDSLSVFFFFSSRRRHTRCYRDWSSDVCSSDLAAALFDIDGTLVDTTAAIREAVTQVLQEEGITPTWEEIKAGWSLRAADRMELWVRERSRAEDLAARYIERYLALQDSLIRPYPGMA